MIQHRKRRRTSAIIVHHTDGPEDQTVEEIRAFHMRPVVPQKPEDQPGRGFRDIGYNWLIRKGEVVKGRPDWATGAHAPGWNWRSVGVALVGNYLIEPPPPEQLVALRRLLAVLLRRYPGATVLGHRDAMEDVGCPDYTKCPGPHWLGPELERLAAAGFLAA